MGFVIILSTLILIHALEYFNFSSGIITRCNLFDRLNRNTACRVISLFEIPIKKIINFARLFCSMIVLRKSSF